MIHLFRGVIFRQKQGGGHILVSHFAVDRECNLKKVFKYFAFGDGHMFEDRLLQ